MEKYSLLETTHLSKGGLDVFKKIGKEAVSTDFALLNGCLLTSDNKSFYFTKTPSNIGGVFCNLGFTSGMDYNVNSKMFGIRPCIYNYDIDNDELLYDDKDFSILSKGYYPQNSCDKKESKILEKKYKNSQLINLNTYFIVFNKKYNIYFDGNEFVVRVISASHSETTVLSNNQKVKKDDIVWVKIKPIIWYYDKLSRILVTKDVIISGVPFDVQSIYKGDFDKTFMNEYLNDIFSNEINLNIYSKESLLELKNTLLNNKVKRKKI